MRIGVGNISLFSNPNGELGSDSDLEFLGITSDKDGQDWIYGGPDAQFHIDAGDGFYIWLSEKTDETATGNSKTSGTIDKGLQNVTDNVTGASAQVANTVVDFGDYWKDGAQIKIGDTTYTVALDPDSKFKNVTNVVDLTDLTGTEEDFDKMAA